LLYKAVPSYFVAVEQLRPKLLANNKASHWVPDAIRDGKFHNWLENARDWAVRYFFIGH
jgi:isoleucyl-tRNA synthetase